MAFLTQRFPDNISYGSKGGPKFNTTITAVNSGFEFANINWDNAKHEYDVALGVRTQSELSDLVRFFHVARGKGHRFRYKDWMDYKSCDVEAVVDDQDQALGTGDGTTNSFQLKKKYTLGGVTVNERTITRPVGTDNLDSTILIAIDDVLKTEDTYVAGVPQADNDYSINYNTGVVTFNTAPILDAVLTWGGEFDVPCRFDTDQLDISLDFYEHGSTSVPVVEVRE